MDGVSHLWRRRCFLRQVGSGGSQNRRRRYRRFAGRGRRCRDFPRFVSPTIFAFDNVWWLLLLLIMMIMVLILLLLLVVVVGFLVSGMNVGNKIVWGS